MEKSRPSYINRFVVPTTIMLTFISFWRAAAIVLADLGSSAYYVGDITEKAIGKSAPWFIFGIMLLSMPCGRYTSRVAACCSWWRVFRSQNTFRQRGGSLPAASGDGAPART